MPTGLFVRHPLTGDNVPVWVGNYVLMSLRRRRGHGRARARRARFRVRQKIRAADQAGDRRRRRNVFDRRMAALVCGQDARPLHQLRQVRRARLSACGRRYRRRPRGDGAGRKEGDVAAARLGHLAPALLGHADPDRALRGLRRRAGAGSRPAGHPAGRLRARRHRQSAENARRFRQLHLSPMRPAGAARNRHDGRVRRFVVVLHALRLPRRSDDGRRAQRVLDADGPVHRRHRARDPAPALRAVLDQGDARHGARPFRRAVHAADDAGHVAQPQLLAARRQGRHRLFFARRRRGAARRRGPHCRRDGEVGRAAGRLRRHRHDVEEQEERHRPGGHHRPVRRGHRAPVRDVRGAARSKRAVVERWRRGRLPVSEAPVGIRAVARETRSRQHRRR